MGRRPELFRTFLGKASDDSLLLKDLLGHQHVESLFKGLLRRLLLGRLTDRLTSGEHPYLDIHSTVVKLC